MLKETNVKKFLNFILSINTILSYVLLYEFITRKNILYTTDFGKMAYDGITVVRGKAFFGSFLNAGIVLSVSCFFAIYFIINTIKNRKFKYSMIYIFYFLSYIVGILSTGSRGPFVIIFAGVIFAIILYGVFLSSNKKLAIKIILSLLAVIVIAVPIILNIDISRINNKMLSFILHRIQSIFNWSSDQGNVERIKSWEFSFGLIKSNPIFGVGVASTGAKGVGSFGIGVTESGLLKKFAEMGVVGLILSYSIFALIMITAIKKLKDKTISFNNKIFILLAASSFFAIMVEDVIYQSTEAEVVSFYLWLIVALIYKGSRLKNIEV
jgi:O-antigen ligase